MCAILVGVYLEYLVYLYEVVFVLNEGGEISGLLGNIGQ